MDNTKRAYVELHIAVILFGFTAILGKWISISAYSIVWWRVLIASISFLFIINVKKVLIDLPRKDLFLFLGIGIIVAAHWLTFYGSIKLSNASIALICLATTSFMTSILEPIILKKPIIWYELMLGILILPGMWLIVSDVQLDMRSGIIMGLFSAFFASIFSILNKKYIHKADPKTISAIEMAGVLLILSIFAPLVYWYNPNIDWIPKGMDWIHLLVLALLCTTLAYVLSLRALKHISAFASNLVINLEPVYGILLAIVLLQEHKELKLSFYIGVLMITVAVFSYPFIKKRISKNV